MDVAALELPGEVCVEARRADVHVRRLAADHLKLPPEHVPGAGRPGVLRLGEVRVPRDDGYDSGLDARAAPRVLAGLRRDAAVVCGAAGAHRRGMPAEAALLVRRHRDGLRHRLHRGVPLAARSRPRRAPRGLRRARPLRQAAAGHDARVHQEADEHRRCRRNSAVLCLVAGHRRRRGFGAAGVAPRAHFPGAEDAEDAQLCRHVPGRGLRRHARDAYPHGDLHAELRALRLLHLPRRGDELLRRPPGAGGAPAGRVHSADHRRPRHRGVSLHVDPLLPLVVLHHGDDGGLRGLVPHNDHGPRRRDLRVRHGHHHARDADHDRGRLL
mmetsp:Transcript_112921/g.315486  ORF Transcript_112921/g.315486 Transcript_112921/m.315486 type:complete len:327 (+) Transcript_112921:709-1689(+)